MVFSPKPIYTRISTVIICDIFLIIEEIDMTAESCHVQTPFFILHKFDIWWIERDFEYRLPVSYSTKQFDILYDTG